MSLRYCLPTDYPPSGYQKLILNSSVRLGRNLKFAAAGELVLQLREQPLCRQPPHLRCVFVCVCVRVCERESECERETERERVRRSFESSPSAVSRPTRGV